MSTLLLDTHAFLWAASDPAQLGDRARALILDPAKWQAMLDHANGLQIVEIVLRCRQKHVEEGCDIFARMGAAGDALQHSAKDIHLAF